MLDFLLWNKIARIIKQLADTLHISTDRALQIFYDSDVCRMLHDKELGLHLMSDTYIVNGNYSAPPMGMSNRLTVVLQQELH